MIILFQYIGFLIYQVLINKKRLPLLNDKTNDQQQILENVEHYDLENNSISFDPPVYRQRYGKVFEALIDERWRTKIVKFCDFGCAEFGLFVFIKHVNRLNEILLVDIDEGLLREYITRVYPLTVEFLRRREEPLQVSVFAGSVGDPDYHILNVDVVTAIELIEHLYPDVLDAFPYNIFNYVEPKLVILTTPNADFNVLFSTDNKRFRHYDHKFEWTREQFEDWATNIVGRFPDYTVSFSGIGEGPEGTESLGECSQMALFIRKDVLDEDYILKRSSITCLCANDSICRRKLESSGITCSCNCFVCSPNESWGICTYCSYSRRVNNLETKVNRQEPLNNIFYKLVEKVEYPFERDSRTEEEKLLDEFRYRIGALGHTYGRFFVEERERSEIPLSDLRYGPNGGNITESELLKLLTKYNYEIEECIIQQTGEVETCVIYKPLMDNITSSSESSDYENNDSGHSEVNESVSDWDDPQNDSKPIQDGNGNSNKDIEGPSVTSADPNERKLARQQRIERRVAAAKVREIIEMGEEVEEEKDPVEVQMEKSAVILEKFLKESQEYLENIRVANETREVDRREAEGIVRADVITQLEAEAAEAQKQFNEIAGKWAGIRDHKDPLHINEDMLEQKIKCDELIQQKDEIIEMLKKELRIAEKKFTNDQMRQNADIRILGQRIEKQINFVKHAYNTELSLIDLVITNVKQKFIDRSNQKWEDLAKKRNEEEIALSDYLFRKRDEMADNIYRLTLFHEDEFRQTKSKLEMDIQKSQNEFERIKYMVLSHNEKVDYNYQVLKRRENENLIIKGQQKRRISKLQDAISDLKSTLSSYRENMTKQITKTRLNIQKMHKSILDIETKADQFAALNEKTFNEIWNMNTKECFGLLEKIFSIDKLLQAQQMGITPDPKTFQKIDKTSMPSYYRAINKIQQINLKPLPSKSSIAPKILLSETEMNSTVSPVYKRLLKYILKKVSSKSGFLTEKRLKQLINNYEDDEQTLVTLNNVFISLEIKKHEDIDFMIEFFLPYCYCPICSNLPSGSFVSSALVSRRLSQASSSKNSFERNEYYNRSVVELEEACEAVQQADALIEEIVLEVVNTEMLVDENGMLKIEIPNRPIGDITHQQELRERRVSKKRVQRRESEKIVCKSNHPLVLSTVYVLNGLKDFVLNYHKQVNAMPTVGERLVKKRYTISRLLEDKDIENYWLYIRNSYNGPMMNTWDSLSEGLMKYLEILRDRKRVSEEVLKLRKRNRDLKRLLAEYMDHDLVASEPNELEWNGFYGNECLEGASQIPWEYPEETDFFEETSSTPSLSSEDNKVHLKRASNLEKLSFVPVSTDSNKMKLDFNRINELDRLANKKQLDNE